MSNGKVFRIQQASGMHGDEDIMFMDVMKAINNRRSIRKLRSDSLSKDEIQIILDAGIKAPSGKNKLLKQLISSPLGQRFKI